MSNVDETSHFKRHIHANSILSALHISITENGQRQLEIDSETIAYLRVSSAKSNAMKKVCIDVPL